VPLRGPGIFYTVLGFIIWNNQNLVCVLITDVSLSTSNIRLVQDPFLVKTQSFAATNKGWSEEKGFIE
jgi:hypothetical protein